MDKVFLAGAASREGLYVAATRGCESVRIFVPDREDFLDVAGLRSEARTWALEFTRSFRPELRSHLGRAWKYIQEVRAQIAALLVAQPGARFLPPPEVHRIPVRTVEHAPPYASSEDYSPNHRHWETPRHGMRVRL